MNRSCLRTLRAWLSAAFCVLLLAQAAQTEVLGQTAQTVSFSAIGNKNYGIPPFEVTAVASSGLPVTFSVVSGPATVSGNLVTITGVGSVVLRASQAGNASYLPASADRSFNANKGNQTITFPAIGGRAGDDPPVELAATASSGLPVTYTILSGPAVLSGNIVSPTSFGTVSVRAAQAGNALYVAATSVTNTFAVTGTVMNTATVVAWGQNNEQQTNVPAGLTGLIGFAAGGNHVLVMKADGTLQTWGSGPQTFVPADLGRVLSFSAGGLQSVALRPNNTVAAWGTTGGGRTNVPATLGAVAAVVTGGEHVLVLKPDGRVGAWGLNTSGQTNVPAGLANVVGLAAGVAHSLALKEDGTVTGWGANTYGQATVPANLDRVHAIAAGGDHSLALRMDGTVRAWGRNHTGQTNVPAGLVHVVAIAAGRDHSMALTLEGAVVVWGATGLGQQIVPGAVIKPTGLAAGYNFGVALHGAKGPYVQPSTLAYQTDGASLLLRANISGALPMLLQWQRNGMDIPDATNVWYKAALAGTYTVVAANDFGTASGQVAMLNSSSGPQVSWTKPADITYGTPLGAVQLSATADAAGTFVYSPSAGTILPGGSDQTLSVEFTPADLQYSPVTAFTTITVNKAAQVVTLAPIPDKVPNAPPFEVTASSSSGLPVALSIVSGPATISGNVVTLTGTGTVRVRAAQAGNANYLTNSVETTFLVGILSQTITFPPIAMTGDTPPLLLSATASSGLPVSYTVISGPAVIRTNILSLTAMGTVSIRATQNGNAGYLAATPVTNTFTPTGSVLNTATIVSWGQNGDSVLNVPAGLTDVVAISSGSYVTMAMRADGTLQEWATGAQSFVPADLGRVLSVSAGGLQNAALRPDNTVAVWGTTGGGRTNVPANLGPVAAVASGSEHTLVVKLNGTVLAWGLNTSGQTNVPAGLANVVAVAAGITHSLALKENGTVVAWGSQTTTPADLTNVVAIAAGRDLSLALKANGTVVAWGANIFGQATVPAGLNNVVAIAAGLTHALALTADGQVVIWGDNFVGQQGKPSIVVGATAISSGHNFSTTLHGAPGPYVQPSTLAYGTEGEAVLLRANVSGALPMTYQWRRDGVDIPNGTNVWYKTADEGIYTVVAANSHGTASGQVARVGLKLTPQITWATPADILVGTPLGAEQLNASVNLPGTLVYNPPAGTVLPAGSNQLTVQYVPNDPVIHQPGAATNTIVVLKVAQTVDFSPIGPKWLIDTPFEVNASASSGLPVTFSIISGPATVSGNVITVSDAGTVVVRATQAGNGTYAAASVDQSFVASRFDQVVTIPTIGPKIPSQPPFEVIAAATSGLPVTLSIVSGPATVSGTTVTLTGGAGTVVLRATQAGNLYYNLASAEMSFEVTKLLQTISFAAIPNQTGDSLPFTVSATASSGLAVTFDVVAGPAVVVDGTVSLTGIGTVAIRASQAGNSDYQAAQPVTQSFQVTGTSLNVSSVVGWGDSRYGQTNVPAGLTGIIGLAAGYDHPLAMKSDGTLTSWGTSPKRVVPAAVGRVLNFSAGVTHSAAVRADNTVIAWALNGFVMTLPAGLGPMVAVAAGGDHTLALTMDGKVTAWGNNNQYGQATVPPGLSNVIAVAAGEYHSLALKRDGTVVAWGRNNYSQTNVPANLTNVVAISAAYFHNLALRADGTVVGWGSQQYWSQATPPAGLTGVVAIAAAIEHSIALKADGTLVAWGRNGDGESTIPFPVVKANAVVAADHYNLALQGANGPYVQSSTLAITSATNREVLLQANVYGSLPMSIEWRCNGDIVANATNRWYVARQPGIYTVTATSSSGSSSGQVASLTMPALSPAVSWPAPAAIYVGTALGAEQLNAVANMPGTFVYNPPLGTFLSAGTNLTLTVEFTPTEPGISPVIATTMITVKKQPQTVSMAINPPGFKVVNSPPFEVTATASSGLPVNFSVVSGPATIAGNVVTLVGGSGQLVLKAEQAGNDIYDSAEATLTVTVQKATQTITFPTLSPKTFGDPPFAYDPVASSGLPVTLSIVSGPATVAGNVITITGAGSVTVRASQAGDNYYQSATQTLSFGVGKAAQTLTFPALSNKTGDDLPFTLSATASSGLPASFNILSGPAVVVGNTVSLTGIGTVRVRALQGGDANYLAAVPVTNSFEVTGTSLNVPAVVAWGQNADQQTNVPAGLTGIISIAAGTYHPLAMRTDGTLLTWAVSGQGFVPEGLGRVLSFSAAGLHSAALRPDNTVAVWGGPTAGAVRTNLPAGLGPVAAVVAGANHTLAVTLAGKVVAWGLNDGGQLNVPAGLSNVVAVSAGNTHSLALKKDGTVAGWGANGSGQSAAPAGLDSVVAIAAGGDHNVVLKANGTVVAWGRNNLGQATVPAGLNNVVAVSAGYEYSAALKADGQVVLWGRNEYGQSTLPAAVVKAGAIAAGHYFALALQGANGPYVQPATFTYASDVSQSVLLRANISGDLPMNVQWKRNGNDILDATNLWYSAVLSGDYSVTVNNSFGTASGPVATLSLPTPIITINWPSPADITVGTALGAAQLNASAPVPGTFVYTPPAGTMLGYGTNQLLSVLFTPQEPSMGEPTTGTTSITVKRIAQTVTIATISSKLVTDAPFGVSATSTSGLPLTWSIDSGPATVMGNLVTITGAGTVVIRATQGGDATYESATATRSFTVQKLNQSITFASVPPKLLTDPPFTVEATATSGLPVTYSILSGPGTIQGNVVTITGAGTITIFASQAGNDTYAATTRTLLVPISKLPQTVTFAPIPTKAVGDPPFEVEATASTGLPVTYAVISGPATMAGNVVTLNGGGTVIIQALQAGNATYVTASATAYITVTKIAQTVTFGPLADRLVADGPLTLSASSSSGLPVELSLVTGGATLSGTTLTVTNEGTITIRASQPGNLTYAAAEPVERSFQATHGIYPTKVLAWGMNVNQETNVPPGLTDVMAISAGAFHPLALRYDGTVICWSVGQQAPVPANLGPLLAMSAGGLHSVGLRPDNTVVAWGNNTYGQTNVPPGLTNVLAISAAIADHSLALKSDGRVVAWGRNSNNQTNVPAGLSNVVAVAAGFTHSLALKNDGTVVAWGWSGHGTTNVPASVTNVIAIAGGGRHSLALRRDGTVVAWGDSYAGKTTVPAGLTNVVAVSAGYDFSMALKSDGTFVMWGINDYKQQVIPGGIPYATAVSGGGYFAMALSGNQLPRVTLPAAARTVAYGQSTAFKANAYGALPLSYQWKLNGTDIPNATNELFSIATADVGAAGSYTVAVANRFGSTSGLVANLSVTNVPVTVTWPTPTDIVYGTALGAEQLNATAGVPGTFTYTPPTGTVLNSGAGQILAVTFTPADPVVYLPTNKSVTINVTMANQTLTIDGVATKTFGDAPFAVTAVSSLGLPVTLSVESGPATITGDIVTITGAGTVTLAAAQAGNANVNAASTSTSFEVLKLDQTIAFPPIANKFYGDAPFALGVSASSGLPVTLSVVSGPASLAGDTLTLTGTGEVTVRATQAGNANVNPAAVVERSFTINKITPVITWNNPAAITPGTALGAAQLNATVDAPGTLVYDPAAGAFLSEGDGQTLSVTFTPDDAARYHGATASVLINVRKLEQTITYDAVGDQSYGVAPLALNATASSGLPVTLSVVSGPATLAGSTLTITSVGAVTLKAMQAGDINYNAAPDVEQTFTVLPAVLTVTANNVSRLFGQANPSFTATITGFVNGETFATSGVTGTPAFSTTANAASSALGNPYPIVPSMGTLTALNYSFLFVNGGLTVVAPNDGAAAAFLQATNFPAGAAPWAIASAAFTSTGRKDLAVANADDGTVSILLGDGKGAFTTGTPVAVGAGPSAVVAADFNLGGAQDLAVANSDDNTVSVLLGNNNGTFGAATTIAVGQRPIALASGDLNKDGLPDLLVAGHDLGEVTVLRGTAAGFVVHATYTLTPGLNTVAVADINKDTNPDAVLANSTDGTVTVLLGAANCTFTNTQVASAGALAIGLAVADFNGDTKLDVAVANQTQNTVTVLLGDAKGAFTNTVAYAVGENPVAVAAIDYFGATRPNLAVANFGGASVDMLFGKGDGTFVFYTGESATHYVVGSQPVALAVSDFNADKDNDLAVALAGDNQVAILMNNFVPKATNISLIPLEDTPLVINLPVPGGLPPTFQLLSQPTNGVLTGTAPNLTYTPNANYNGVDTFRYQVHNGFKTSSIAVVSMNVANVNDAPTQNLLSTEVTIAEDAGKQTNLLANLLYAGAPNETSQTFSYVVVNNASNLFLTQPAVVVNQTTKTASLTYTAKTNAFGVAEVSLRLKDSGGVGNGGVDLGPVEIFTITITNINDAPVPAKPTVPTILENSFVTVNFTTTDLESAGDELVYTMAGTNTLLFPNPTTNFVFGGSGSARTLTVYPAATESGTDKLTLTVSDGTNSAVQTNISVTVLAVNNVPSFDLNTALYGTGMTVPHNGAAVSLPNFAINLSAGPANENAQTLSFLVSTASPGVFSAQPAVNAAGTLTFNPKAGTPNGTVAVISVRIKDNGSGTAPSVNTSAAQSFTITFTNP